MSAKTALIEMNLYGKELEFSKLVPLTDLEIGKALNWYNYVRETSDARKYLNEWLRSNARENDIILINKVPDIWFSTTSGWIARLLNEGYQLPDGYKDRLNARIETMKQKIPLEDNKQKNIMDFKDNKTNKILADFESILDIRDMNFSMYSWIQSNSISTTIAQKVKEYIMPWYNELLEAASGKDEQLVEAYSRYPKDFLKKNISWFEKIIADIDQFCNNVTKTKAPKVISKKKIDLARIFKTFKYAKQMGKMVSIAPERILAAKELWLYDPQYKKLTVLRTDDKFEVRGSTIYGFNDSKSCAKSINKNTEEMLNIVQNNPKANLKLNMDNNKATPYKASGYCMDRTMILRAF